MRCGREKLALVKNYAEKEGKLSVKQHSAISCECVCGLCYCANVLFSNPLLRSGGDDIPLGTGMDVSAQDPTLTA